MKEVKRSLKFIPSRYLQVATYSHWLHLLHFQDPLHLQSLLTLYILKVTSSMDWHRSPKILVQSPHISMCWKKIKENSRFLLCWMVLVLFSPYHEGLDFYDVTWSSFYVIIWHLTVPGNYIFLWWSIAIIRYRKARRREIGGWVGIWKQTRAIPLTIQKRIVCTCVPVKQSKLLLKLCCSNLFVYFSIIKHSMGLIYIYIYTSFTVL